MRLRLLSSVLLLSASCLLLGQNAPDFSGVYLRDRAKSGLRAGAGALGQRIRLLQEVDQALDDGSMLILVVTQTADSIEVTKIQNGAKATSHYDLSSSKSKKVRSRGSEMAARAKLKNQTLLIEYNAQLPWFTAPIRVKENWQLSSDSRVLTIQPLPSGGSETYTRQASLDSALARAFETSLMNKCMCLQFSANDRSNYEGKARLGFTAFQQLNTCISFDADLLGEFFKGLERCDTPKGTWFRKSGQSVSEFPDNVVLEITPRISKCSPESLSIIPSAVWQLPLPPELLGLRFRIRWTGSTARDLGELQPEFFIEPSSDLRPPERFYRVDVPSDGVPVTDNLEIRILTSAGNQIGCISGHI